MVISSSTAVVIALTWGGVQFPWTSAHVLVPFVLGLTGIFLWLIYEAKWATNPIVRCLLPRDVPTVELTRHVLQLPYKLLANRTSLSG